MNHSYNGQKTIQEILSDVSRWLWFQKRMGLEYLPNHKELYDLLHNSGLHRPEGTLNERHSPAPTLPKAGPQRRRQQLTQAMVQGVTVPSFSCKDFSELQSALAACPGCEASDAKRPVPTKPVQEPQVLVVTDAINYEEELAGSYFTGPAMELLNNMLKAIDIPLNQVYSTGLFKCRTSTKPKRADVERCASFLMAEIRLLKPRAILSFTPLLSWPLLGKTASLSRLRGKAHIICMNEQELAIFFTHSPNTILKTTGNAQKALKLEVWKDLQTLQETLKKTGENT